MEQLETLRLRADRGEMDAQYELAMKYIYADGVEENLPTAAALLEEAALQGHVEAAYHLAVCYHYGRGVEIDLRTAYQLYLRSAMQGYGKGFNLVGDFYAQGICVRQNHREAIKWYLDGASCKDPDAVSYAEYKLAVILAEGYGVEADLEGAKEWFRKAIDHGEERAKAALERLGVDGKVQIREARLTDAESIWRLNLLFMGYEYPLDAMIGQFSSMLDSRGHKFFVAVADGRVVGFIHGTDFDTLYSPPMKRILQLVVDESYRGRGIGRSLLEKIENWAMENDCYMVCVTVSEERLESRFCVNACGYERTPDQVHFRKML